MSKLASKVVAQAVAWIGLNEADGSHKKIVDIYNSHQPLARCYKLKDNDQWCAATVSAVAIEQDCTDIIPTEVSCQKMIDLFKQMGCWVEDESVVPEPGWIIFYDWQDDGKGDNTGWADHVGIVENVVAKVITAVEGNYKNAVKRRQLTVGGKYIRGYGVPRYDPEPEKKEEFEVKVPVLRKGDKGPEVKGMQRHLIGYGFSCGSSGADGSFGPATEKALKAYQKANGLEQDGIRGPATFKSMNGL